MADPSPPRRWYCWVVRWWQKHITPHRRSIVRSVPPPTLMILEDRNAPTPLEAIPQIAPPPI
jgi:hypothetical protein